MTTRTRLTAPVEMTQFGAAMRFGTGELPYEKVRVEGMADHGGTQQSTGGIRIIDENMFGLPLPTFQKQNLIAHPLDGFEKETLLTRFLRISVAIGHGHRHSASYSATLELAPAFDGIQRSIENEGIGAEGSTSARSVWKQRGTTSQGAPTFPDIHGN